MSFIHGKDTSLIVNGTNISGYFKSFSISGSADISDTTAIGNQDRTFIAGLKNGTMSAEGMFDGAASTADAQLAALLAVNPSIWLLGVSAGGYNMSAIETEYSVTTPVDDVVSVTVSAQSNTSIERATNLHVGAETSTGDGTTDDNGASTANGGAAYVHNFFAAGGGTLDLILTHSATGAFAGEETTLATFTQITATGVAERVAFTGTVERYVRAEWTLGGTPDFTFFASIHRAV